VKLLLTTDTVGGVWTHTVELSRGLARRGVGVTLAAMGTPLTQDQRAELRTLPLEHLYADELALEWMPDPWEDVERAARRLLEIADRTDPDAVHVNQYAFGALEWERPCVVGAHSDVLTWFAAVRGRPAPPEWNRYRDVVAEGIASADVVVAPTAAYLRELVRAYEPTSETAVIHNGRALRGAKASNEPLILTAGRLWDEAKNAGALWRTAGELPWPVAFAGQGIESGLPDAPPNVRLLGRLSRSELDSWLRRAAVFASPARYEPFGLAALEAAQCGCALVVGDLPSQREIWRDAALYVDPDDEHALAETLRLLIGDDALRGEYARRARNRARAFHPQRMADEYLELYERLLARDADDELTREALAS
jgi:glycosyltransferase involved in cell wall biosynthesis